MEMVELRVGRTEAVLDQVEILQQNEEEEEEEESGRDSGSPKDSSILINHTGVVRLLLLGPIAEMSRDTMKSKKIRDEK
jgi:hypothetical protein